MEDYLADIDAARKAAQAFLDAWAGKRWGVAFQHTQETWKSTHEPDGRQTLRSRLSQLVVWRPTVQAAEAASDTVVDVQFALFFKFPQGYRMRRGTMRLVCERGPYTPAHDGMWGVNPNSISFSHGNSD